MKMFETFLESIPKNRSLIVNELDLPEDITLSPYIWTEPEESLTVRSDSILSGSIGEYEVKTTASTDSSMPLSRALTDSEIDYGRYRRVSFKLVAENVKTYHPCQAIFSTISFQQLNDTLFCTHPGTGQYKVVSNTSTR